VRIPPTITSVFCAVVLFGLALPSVAAPIPALELYLGINYGRFMFGDWGYKFEVGNSHITKSLTIGGIDVGDFNFEFTGGSDSLLSITERTVDAPGGTQLAHEYTFGPGSVDLTFDYHLHGVHEHGVFSGTLGPFTTEVTEGNDRIIANIGYGEALVLGGVLDARTAYLFGLPQRMSDGKLILYFDNERRLLGRFGDPVREAAVYGGPLTVTAPEPSVSALLIVAGAALVGLRARRRGPFVR
jgi:hypothetical protein